MTIQGFSGKSKVTKMGTWRFLLEDEDGITHITTKLELTALKLMVAQGRISKEFQKAITHFCVQFSFSKATRKPSKHKQVTKTQIKIAD